MKVVFCTKLAIPLLLVSALAADQPKAAPPAPVPTQILTAKRVFVANTGSDEAEAPDRAYNNFYAAMKAWGHYELVGAPSDAELVLEVRVVPFWVERTILLADFGVELTILDARTHFILWTLVEPVKPTAKKATWNQNLGQAVANLVGDVKSLTAGASK